MIAERGSRNSGFPGEVFALCFGLRRSGAGTGSATEAGAGTGAGSESETGSFVRVGGPEQLPEPRAGAGTGGRNSIRSGAHARNARLSRQNHTRSGRNIPRIHRFRRPPSCFGFKNREGDHRSHIPLRDPRPPRLRHRLRMCGSGSGFASRSGPGSRPGSGLRFRIAAPASAPSPAPAPTPG